MKLRVRDLAPERVAPSPAGEVRGGAESDRRTVTKLTSFGDRMAGKGRKSRILVTCWRVLVAGRVLAPMPSTVASGGTVGAVRNMSETVGALDNMLSTEAVGDDTDELDDGGVRACASLPPGMNDAMLLRNWSVRPIFLPGLSVSTTRLFRIGRLVKAQMYGDTM